MGVDPICFEEPDSSNTDDFVMENYERVWGFSFMPPKFPTIVMMPDLKISLDNLSRRTTVRTDTNRTVRSKGT